MKRKLLKAILCIIISISMILPTVAVPVKTQAKESHNKSVKMLNESSETDINNDISAKGNGSLGKLLAKSINEKKEESSKEDTLNHVSELKVKKVNQEVTVEVVYEVEKDAQIVVGIFSDSKVEKMLASQESKVKKTESKVSVSFGQIDLPEYYIVKAFLVDFDTKAPIAKEFIEQEHTHKMQEFYDKDIDTFLDEGIAEDHIINLDNDNTQNYIVFNNDVIMPTISNNVNVPVLEDEDGKTYKFNNPDKIMLGLKNGDVIYYTYNGANQVIKVADISKNSDEQTITVKGEEIDFADAFTYIDINLVSNTLQEKTKHSSSKLKNGIDESCTAGFNVIEIDTSEEKETSFGGNKENKGWSGSAKVSSTLKGSMGITGEVTIHYDLELFEKDDLKIEISETTKISLSGELSVEGEVAYGLGKYTLISYPAKIPVIELEIEPKIVLKGSAAISVNGLEISKKNGIKYDTEEGSTDTSEKMQINDNLDLSGEADIFLGIDLGPSLSIISDDILECELSTTVGVYMSASTNDTSKDPDLKSKKYHDCDLCISGDLFLGIEFEVTLKTAFMEPKKIFSKSNMQEVDDAANTELEIEGPSAGLGIDSKWKIGSFYVSTRGGNVKFAIGRDVSCPYDKNLKKVSLRLRRKNGIEMGVNMDEAVIQLSSTDPMACCFYEDDDKVKADCEQKISLGDTVFYVSDGIWNICVLSDGEVYNVIPRNINVDSDKSIDLRIVDDEEIDDDIIDYNLEVKEYEGLKYTINNGVMMLAGTQGENFDEYTWWSFWSSIDSEIKKSIKRIKVKIKGLYNCAYMFCECKAEVIDLSELDTSHVTNMHNMFQYCTNLKKLDLSNFDTSKVTDMSDMFMWCIKLRSIDLSSFDTSEVTDMSGMFATCNKLSSLDLSNFDTSEVTYMSSMFRHCTNLKNLDLSNFDTRKVTNMGAMFFHCTRLNDLDISSFDMSNVVRRYAMFLDCPLKKVYGKDGEYINSANKNVNIKKSMKMLSSQNDGDSLSFSNLVSGMTYNLYIVKNKSLRKDNMLSSENLLYIAQCEADKKGCIDIQFKLKENIKDYQIMLVAQDASSKDDYQKDSVEPVKTSGTAKIAKEKKVKLRIVNKSTGKEINENLKWTSSNKKYATVSDKGIVMTKKAGAGKTVTITASSTAGNDFKAVYKIKIMKHEVKNIKLFAKKKTVKAGKKLALKANVKTSGKDANKKLKWISNNEKYATVSSKGVVNAKKSGKKVTITAVSTDGTNKKASLRINIK